MLPTLTITFILGLALGSYVSSFPLSSAILLTICTVGALLVERQKRFSPRQTSLWLACLCGGCVYWILYAWLAPHSPVPERPGGLPTRVIGTIVDSVRHAPGRQTALVRVTSSDDPDLVTPFHLRLTWRDPDRDLHRGVQIRVRTRLHAPTGTINPRGFDYAAYLDQQGVEAVGSISGAGAVEVLDAGAPPLIPPVSRLSEHWRALVRSAADSLSQPTRGLFLSLTIGEQGFLAPDAREWFMTTGTVHILSISGSHLGLIALISFALIRKLCLLLPPKILLSLSRWLTPTRAAALLTLLPVGAYTLLAGAETATIRSSLMIMIGLWTVWLGAPHFLLHALAAAAGLTLLVHPAALYDISFQLSYVSVWVLALALRRGAETAELPRLQPSKAGWMFHWLRESVRLTAWVTLATLPLVACYFNQVSWMGLFVNVAMVPFIGLVFLPISLLAALWVIVTHADAIPGAAFIEWLGRGLIDGTHWLADLPGAEWFVAAPTVPMMVLFYLLGWVWLSGRLVSATPLVRGALVGCLAGIVMWWLWSPRPFTRDGHVRVTFLDVGQGDSAVIELPQGAVVLIDGGATYERVDMGRSVVAPFLWNRGIRHIDHIVGTHPQLDHVGGLAWILGHFQVEHFWTNGVTRPEEFWQKIERALLQRHVSATVAQEGRLMAEESSCRLVALNPAPVKAESAGGKRESLNNLSVVTQLTCGEQQMLFTGDAERDALARLTQVGSFGHITLLKVPHHGAKSSLERGWLETTRPDVAVMSVARHNPYGHPAGEVLAAYEAVQAQVWRTDRDGAVWVDVDPTQRHLVVHSAREWTLQPVPFSVPMWALERENWHRLWRRWNWL
ncbi:MAG TPA: DNA internalization-related competence protein ComEC/Rec2 [Nitrospira sp.]|nr:DNA internalization-related competence protein ComEC/Rec2 [Nitrospira sp.]